MTYVFWTYLARFLGILLIIPSLFPLEFANRFPGLEDRRIGWALFGIGVAVFIAASLSYHVLRKKEIEKKNADSQNLNSSADVKKETQEESK